MGAMFIFMVSFVFVSILIFFIFIVLEDCGIKISIKKLGKMIAFIVVYVLLVYGFVNHTAYPSYDKNEVENLLNTHYKEKIDDIKKHFGVSDLSLRINILNYEFTKRTLRSLGEIDFEGEIIIQSNQFKYLEKGKYDDEGLSKYSQYNDVFDCFFTIPGYLTNESITFPVRYIDSSGNVYYIDSFTGDLYKNDILVYDD